MSIFSRKGVLLVAAAALLLALALPAFANGSKEGGGAMAQGGKMYIPVISKGFQHQFWQTVKKGAEAAAAQLGVQITFEGPPTEADIQPQVQMLVNDMAKNPAAICLAALDTNSVMDQLNQAIQRHIPIIGFDSGVPNAPKGAIYATAATNSYAAAGLAADHMFAAIKDKIAAASDANPVTIVDFNQDATSQSVPAVSEGENLSGLGVRSHEQVADPNILNFFDNAVVQEHWGAFGEAFALIGRPNKHGQFRDVYGKISPRLKILT